LRQERVRKRDALAGECLMHELPEQSWSQQARRAAHRTCQHLACPAISLRRCENKFGLLAAAPGWRVASGSPMRAMRLTTLPRSKCGPVERPARGARQARARNECDYERVARG
jgi:hypothetical protein